MPGTTSPIPSTRSAACSHRHPRHTLHQLGDQRVGIEDRLERLHQNGRASEIGEHHVGAAESNVDADGETIARPHVQQRGFASAIGFAELAFDHGALGE
jgi:hypothetical protein